jgi:spectinomycin phosphotransferase
VERIVARGHSLAEVRTRPPDLDDDAVTRSLADGWGVEVGSMSYVPEGGGSHHWKATDADGGIFFVRVDDLDDKDWLGGTRDVVFEGLGRALATAGALRSDADLAFVVAPLHAADGTLVRRLTPRYAMSLYPYLAGVSYPFGPYTDEGVRSAAIEMVVAVHRAAPIVGHLAPQHVPRIGRREHLDAFLGEPDRPWDAGPLGGQAHDLLAPQAATLVRVVRAYDDLVEATSRTMSATVVTHGEPHPANVMSVSKTFVLIDWDTVALAAPERDLWMVAPEGDELFGRYEAATGHHVDPRTMTLYRLRWYLDDIASAVQLLGSPHELTADSQRWSADLASRIESLGSWRQALA